MKTKFLVIGLDNDTEDHELIGAYDTYEQAEKVLFQCQEGDDKHAPMEYSIERGLAWKDGKR